MRVAFIGDIHGNTNLLQEALAKCAGLVTIQVGDLDVDRMSYGVLQSLAHNHMRSGGEFYWIDGNHDDLSHMRTRAQPESPLPYPTRLHNIDRGDLVFVQGTRILALGGGESVAPYPALGWHPLEAVSGHQCDMAKNHRNVHAMVTHVPPACIIEKYLNLAPTVSSKLVQSVWEHHNKPPLICGHIHRSIEADGVRVLGIGEVYIHEFPDTQRIIRESPAEQALSGSWVLYDVTSGNLQALELPPELL